MQKHPTDPEALRTTIAKLLHDLRRPMTSTEIAELLAIRFSIQVDTLRVGVNLGYLRAAGVVERQKCINEDKPLIRLKGRVLAQTENLWWHRKTVTKAQVIKVVRAKRRTVEQITFSHNMKNGKRSRPIARAITDDMKQMVEDFRNYTTAT